MVKKSRKLSTLIIPVGLSLFIACSLADSADFPKKPVKIVVTAGAGAGEDNEARGIAPYVGKYLGVNVMIEDQPGAGGKIALEKFQRTKPDGHTLITYTFPKSIIGEYISKTNYRTKDFTQIFVWSCSYNTLLVHADTWKTFDEFLKSAKSKILTGGLSGRAGNSHLSALLTADELGIKVNWVPYDGAAGSLAALAGKHMDFTIGSVSAAASLIKAGRIRPLLLFSDKRDPYFPDIPHLKDLRLNIPFLSILRGVEAPPNTPPNIVKILENAFNNAVKEPAYLQWAKNASVIIRPLNAQEFGKVVAETYPMIERFQDVLKEN